MFVSYLFVYIWGMVWVFGKVVKILRNAHDTNAKFKEFFFLVSSLSLYQYLLIGRDSYDGPGRTLVQLPPYSGCIFVRPSSEAEQIS